MNINKELLLQRIKSLADEKGINLNTVYVESGAGKNFKSNMTTSNPSLGKITLIANYLGTTTEYLLGTSDVKEKKSSLQENFTFEELEIINAYRNQPEVARRVVRRALGLEGISPEAATAAYGGKDTQTGNRKE